MRGGGGGGGGNGGEGGGRWVGGNGGLGGGRWVGGNANARQRERRGRRRGKRKGSGGDGNVSESVKDLHNELCYLLLEGAVVPLPSVRRGANFAGDGAPAHDGKRPRGEFSQEGAGG